MGKDIAISQDLQTYILNNIKLEPEVLTELAEETKALGDAFAMQISWLQGCFMQNLVRMINAKNTIEIGVFTGYSTLATALALPDDGKIIALDVDESWTDIGKKYWKQAGVENKIDLRLAPALDSLNELIDNGHKGSFDMVFIDADKVSMGEYLNAAHSLLRVGGLVIADNVLWSEKILDASDNSEDTKAIKAFNKNFATDKRFHLSMVPIGDGLSLGIKK